MRTVAGADAAQPTSALGDFTDAVRIEVADSTDVLVDLSEFAVAFEYDQSVDEIVDACSVVFRRVDTSFKRATVATYHDVNGVLQTAGVDVLRDAHYESGVLQPPLLEASATNLIVRSKEFDNASWVKTRSSIGADADIAPDGTLTADRLVEDTSAATTHLVNRIVTFTANAPLTFSVYLKAGTRTFSAIQISGSGALIGTYVNLSAGTLGTQQLSGTATLTSRSIVALANGWYRVTLSGSLGGGLTSAGVPIYLAEADNDATFTGDGSSYISVWGAQFEEASAATSYIATTSVAVTRAADIPGWESVNSLAPLMAANPPVALGRRIVVAVNPGGGTYREVFRGRIDMVDWPQRFGDVTIQCRDQAGVAADTQIETARAYGSTAGVSLETVMQAVADDNLTAPPTIYFPAPTSGVVQHLEGDPPYGPSDESVLDAERALIEAIGGTIRWRNFDASPSDWKWTAFLPSRSKTVADHTFAPSSYWDVTTMKQEIVDIRNVVRVEFVGAGETMESVTVEDAASIAKYGRRFMRITEGSGSPINNSTLATALASAALSDLKEPDALLEITGRYFWPGEIGVDLYTFTANNKHFSTDQTLAAMGFRHRIAVGERPTTFILTRGKPSGGMLMWRRRGSLSSGVADAPDLRVENFREVARTETAVTFGWDVAGAIQELWLYLSTPAQPVPSDPWAALAGVPDTRLTPDSISFTVSIPNPGLVTYGRLVPISDTLARGQSWDFTVQGAGIRLGQRASVVSSTPTQIVVRVAVINPITGADVLITYTGGLTVTPASGQTVLAANVTGDYASTGTVDFTITRPAYGSGTGRVTFTATSTDRTPDVDAVDVPAVEISPPSLTAEATPGPTSYSIAYSGSYMSVEYSLDGAAYVAAPASPIVVTRNAAGGADKTVSFRAIRDGVTASAGPITVPAQAPAAAPPIVNNLRVTGVNNTTNEITLAWDAAQLGSHTMDLDWSLGGAYFGQNSITTIAGVTSPYTHNDTGTGGHGLDLVSGGTLETIYYKVAVVTGATRYAESQPLGHQTDHA